MMARIGRGVESMSSIPEILVKTTVSNVLYYKKKGDERTGFTAKKVIYTLECQHNDCEWVERIITQGEIEDEIYQHITWHEEGMQP